MTHISKKHDGLIITAIQVLMPIDLSVNPLTEEGVLTDPTIKYNPVVEILIQSQPTLTVEEILQGLIKNFNDDVNRTHLNTEGWDVREINSGDIFFVQTSGLNLQNGIDLSSVDLNDMNEQLKVLAVKQISDVPGEITVIPLKEDDFVATVNAINNQLVKVYLPSLDRYGYAIMNAIIGNLMGRPSVKTEVLIDNTFIKFDTAEILVCPRIMMTI
jgi:hypothetical protein